MHKKQIKMEVDVFSKVRDVIRQLPGRDTEIKYLGQILDENNYLMVYGIVPEKEILLQCNFKRDEEIENPREYLAQIRAELREEPLDFAKIAQKLEKIRDDSSMHQILGDLIVVLVPYIENCITINSFLEIISDYMVKSVGKRDDISNLLMLY